MAKDKKPTKEETEAAEKAKAQSREYSLKNLDVKSSISGIAAAYLADKKNAFGDSGNAAVDQYIYRQALDSGVKYTDPNTGKESGLISSALLGSRRDSDGARYAGNVSERTILKQGIAILSESLQKIKVSDMVQLLGEKYAVKKEYADKYISETEDLKLADALEGLSEEDKKALGDVSLQDKFTSDYLMILTDTKVMEALGARIKDTKKGLEGILKAPEKKK